MAVNWRVRLQNKAFWVAIIPALVILAQTILPLFKIQIDLSGTQEQLLAVVDIVFVILVIFGVVKDPTTPGFGDSPRAMRYIKPGVLPEDEV